MSTLHIIPTPDYELIKDAYAIIDGIPEESFNLDQWFRPARGACGTIACAAGWLAQHPDFNALGLKITHALPVPHVNDRHNLGYHALGEVLGIDYDVAESIFCSREIVSELDPKEKLSMTDKQLWLTRVRNYLKQHNQLTPVEG